MQCQACGCQDGEYNNGISKKTGKPWASWDCANQDCKKRNFINQKGGSNTFTQKPATPQGPNHLQSIDITLKNILAILQAKSGVTPMQEEELQPDQEFGF